MDTIRFREIAGIFEGVQLTDDNIEEVAEWCDGELRSFDGKLYLKIVDTTNDLVVKTGSWVLRDSTGKYTTVADDNLLKIYEMVEKPSTFQSEVDKQNPDISGETDLQEGPSEALEGPSERVRVPKPHNPTRRG